MMYSKSTKFRMASTLVLVILLAVLAGCSFTVVDDRPPEVAAATQTARAEAIPVVDIEPNLLPTVTPDDVYECPIKGNISRTGEKIYHVPGQANYDQVVIDHDHDELYFCTEEDAVAAGWRKAQR